MAPAPCRRLSAISCHGKRRWGFARPLSTAKGRSRPVCPRPRPGARAQYVDGFRRSDPNSGHLMPFSARSLWHCAGHVTRACACPGVTRYPPAGTTKGPRGSAQGLAPVSGQGTCQTRRRQVACAGCRPTDAGPWSLSHGPGPVSHPDRGHARSRSLISSLSRLSLMRSNGMTSAV